MKKIIYTFILFLPILLLSCSGSNNESELKRQLEISEQKNQELIQNTEAKGDAKAKLDAESKAIEEAEAKAKEETKTATEKNDNKKSSDELQKNIIESSFAKEIVNIADNGKTYSYNVSKEVKDLLHEMEKESVLSNLGMLQRTWYKLAAKENTSTEENEALQLMYSVSEKRINERRTKILKEYEEKRAAEGEEAKAKEEGFVSHK